MVGALLAGFTGGYVLGSSREPTGASRGANPSTPPAATGTVRVSVHDVTGARGLKLAVVLYFGVPPLLGGQDEAGAIGGFGVTVTSDPFAVVHTVAEGHNVLEFLEAWQSPGPAVDVPAGAHTLWITLGRDVSNEFEFVGTCQVHVAVRAGQMTVVAINGVPRRTTDIPVCELG